MATNTLSLATLNPKDNDEVDFQRTEEYKTSAFIGKINLDMKEIKKEEENYVPLPTYYSFKDKTGKDRKDETLMAQF